MIVHQGPTVIARFPTTNDDFLLYARSIEDKLTGNLSLPSPNPSLAVYGLAVDALDDATTKAEDRSSAAVAHRNAKALKVRQHIGHIVDYVQEVADTQVNAAEAIALIVGAGLSVKKTGTRKKAVLAAKYTGFSGEVLLVALAIASAGAYYWEYSLDQSAWAAVPETTAARVRIAGLTPGRVYYFRFHALTKKGKTDDSQIVSFMMH